MNEVTPLPRGLRWGGLAALVAAAAGLRIWVALSTGAVHPDEIFQYLEQAHRAAFGYGVVTWEYRYGMRSWLLPLLLSGPMALGGLIAPDGDLYLLLPRIFMALSSLLILPAAYGLGALHSRLHAVIALVAAAFWFELAYYGGHVLTEPAATALILPAAALLMAQEPKRGRLILAGLLFGLAAILRFHYLPAIGVLVLASGWGDWRRVFPPLILGGLAALAIGAAVDVATGLTPFGWMFANFSQNIVANRSADFGVSPPLAYLATINDAWSLAFVPIVALALIVARTYYPLLLAAFVNLAVHSAIGHKEYRFILLAIAILVIVAAIGSAELVRRFASRWPGAFGRGAPVVLALAWIGVSAWVGLHGWSRETWQTVSSGSEATARLRQAPALCGVGLVDVNFWDTGGYAYLHRDVPIYVAASPLPGTMMTDLAEVAPAFNAIIAPPSRESSLPPGYRRLSCARGLAGATPACAYVRAGGCNASAGAVQRLDAVMARRDW